MLEPAQQGVQPEALLGALGQEALQRHWPLEILLRGARLVAAGAVQAFEAATEGAISAAQARVQGGSLYRVSLTHAPGTAWRGACDCPHAAGGNACKHQAAVALHWRRQLGVDRLGAAGEPHEAMPAASFSPAPPPRAEEPWRAFVRQQEAAPLAERMLAWADRVPELRRELQQWQRMSAPVGGAGEAKKLVTSLLSGASDLWEVRKVRAWVRKAEGVLTLIDGWQAGDPSLALAGAEAAYLKLTAILGGSDDSHGDIQALMQEVADRWLKAVQAVGALPAAYADRVQRLIAADEWGHLDLDAALPVLGAAVQGRLGKQLAQRWTATREEGEGGDEPRETYLRFLNATGDVDEIVRVRRHRLRHAHDHLLLVQALLQHGRHREALQAAEHAHKLHGDDARLTDALAALYERDGWDDEALALRQAAFERRPSNVGYHALLASAQRAGRSADELRERLWQALHAAYQRAQQGRTPMGCVELGGLMLNLWIDEGRADEAQAWLSADRQATASAVMRLARTLAPAQPDAALSLYKTLLLTQMQRASSPYTHELALVREAVSGLPRDASRLWLAWLKLEYRTKPRFVAGLAGL